MNATLWKFELSINKKVVMKTYVLLISILGALLFSCKKDNADIMPDSIAGTWKMIMAKDNNTNIEIIKPATEKRDVILIFNFNNSTSGVPSGNTPNNVFGPNDYTLGPNQTISMSGLNMTEISETPWGREFADNIRNPLKYGFQKGKKLNIITNNKTLTFLKQ